MDVNSVYFFFEEDTVRVHLRCKWQTVQYKKVEKKEGQKEERIEIGMYIYVHSIVEMLFFPVCFTILWIDYV